MAEPRSTKKQGQMWLLRRAWRYGGRVERFFAIFIPASPLMPLVFAVLFVLLIPQVDAVTVFVAALVVIAGWPLLRGALYDSAYSQEFHRQALAQGWVRAEEREFYTQLIRWREQLGRRGRSPGQLRWGLGVAVMYTIMSVATAPFIAVSYPLIGDASAAAYLLTSMFVMIVCGVAYSLRVQHWFRDAQSKGFQLSELRRKFR